MIDVNIRVAEAIDQGQIPWRFYSGLPRNVVTGKYYEGVNPVLLEIGAQALGSMSPWWGTAQDWLALGGRVVQPPAQGVTLFPTGDVAFNWDQTDRAYEPPALVYRDPAPVFDAIVKNVGVKIEYAFNQDCKYFGAKDVIRMPHRMMFEIGPGGVSGYYDALGHEIMHATERRVGWDGDPDVNELRAEIGSGYLLGALGINPLPLHLARHHRKYTPRWSRLLRQQPLLLLRVCQNVMTTLVYLLWLAGLGTDVNFAPDTLVQPEEGVGIGRISSWRGT